MITWIQTVLQKHHKSVFSVLLFAIIIAFVFTIGSVPFFGDSYHSGKITKKDFYGVNFSDENAVSRLQNFAYYEIIFSGEQPRSEQQFMNMMMRQAYLRHLANELGISQISQNDLTAYVQSAPLFRGKDGLFDAALFKKFFDARVASGRMTEEMLSYIISQNALVDKVAKLLGGPGYMPKFEIENQYETMYGSWNFDMAVLSSSDFKPEIKPSDEQLEKYFKANMEAYRIGEGVVVETMFVPASDFTKQSVPTEAEIKAYYAANMNRYSTTKDAKPYTPKLSEVRESVKTDMVLETSVRAASKKAEDLVMKVYNSEVKMGSAEFKKLMSDEKVSLKKSAPIRRTDTAAPKGIPTQVATASLKLDEAKFYTDPIATENGVWVAFLSERLAAYLPKFADVKAKVLADYTEAEKAKLFAAKADTLQKALVKAVADKKSFASVARAGGAKVELVRNFSLANPQSSGEAVLRAYSVVGSTLPKLQNGGVSKVQTYGENAYIIDVVKFTSPADKADSKKIADLAKRMEQVYSATSSMTVISEKINAATSTLEEK